MRWFNTSGPIEVRDHDWIPLLQRIDWGCVLSLMRRKQHFIRHAPRRCGKTSAVVALPSPLNSGSAGTCRRVRVNLESGQSAPEDAA